MTLEGLATSFLKFCDMWFKSTLFEWQNTCNTQYNAIHSLKDFFTGGQLQNESDVILCHVTDNLKGGDDLDTNYVLSSRVRTGRSIRGLGLPPHCTKEERKEVEKVLCDALATLSDEFSGTQAI